MTNKNSPAGGRIVTSNISAEFVPNINEYLVPATDSDEFFVGDFVKTDDTSEDGLPVCIKAAAGDTLRGIVVGFKVEHERDSSVYRAPSTRRIAMICDDPWIEFEIQINGTLTSTDIGKNADLVVASGSPQIGVSASQIDISTVTTNTAQLKILRLFNKEKNAVGEYSKVIAMIHEHELNAVGGGSEVNHDALNHLTYDTAGHGNGFTGFQRGTTLSAIDPTATDDDSLNYVKGDLWLNTASSRAFICVDNSTGAAVWDQLEHSLEDIWERNTGTDTVTLANAGDTVDIETSRVMLSYIDFYTSFAEAMQEGRMAWDSDAGTIQIGMPGGNVNLQLGQEMYLPNRPKNSEAIDIDNGQLVYISGATGSVPAVKLANANDFCNACHTIAMATEDVISNQRGFYTTFGVVRDIDTDSYTEGTELWLDTTDGGYTDTRPVAPACSVRIGYVVRQHATEGEIFVTIDVERNLVDNDITKEPTGFTAPEDVIVTYDDTLRTITLTGTVNAYYKGEPIELLTSGWVSESHSSDPGEYFLIFDGTYIAGVPQFTWVAAGVQKFYNLLIAYVYNETATFALRECHGVQPWQSHKELHEVIGTHKESGGSLADYTLSSTTAADRRPSVSTAVVDDEDLPSTIPSLPANGPYTNFTLFNVDEASLSTGGLDIVPLSGNQPYWNEFTGGAWQQTLMSNNYYMSIWLVAVPCTADATSQSYRYLWIQGQAESLTLTGQQDLSPNDVSLGDFNTVVPEFVFIQQVIIRYTAANWSIIEVRQIDGTRYSQSSSPQGSGLQTVEHDTTLTGSGTVSDPLGSALFSLTGTDVKLIQDTFALPAGTTVNELSIDGTLAGNSDDAIPTEKAVKTYVDGHSSNGLWQRATTTISPKNAGDYLDMGTGKIASVGNNLVLESNSGVQMLAGTTIVQAVYNGALSMVTAAGDTTQILSGGDATFNSTTNTTLSSTTGHIHIIADDHIALETDTNEIARVDDTGLEVSSGSLRGPVAINNQTGTTYTLALSDLGGVVTVSNIAAIAVTLPQDSTLNLPVGFNCTIVQGDSGQITLGVEGTDNLYSADSLVKIRTSNAAVTVIKRASGNWYVSGDMTA